MGAMASSSAASKATEQAENEHRGISPKSEVCQAYLLHPFFSPARRVSRLAKFPGRRGPAFPLPETGGRVRRQAQLGATCAECAEEARFDWRIFLALRVSLPSVLPDRRRFIHLPN